jgi:hypothetical protein
VQHSCTRHTIFTGSTTLFVGGVVTSSGACRYGFLSFPFSLWFYRFFRSHIYRYGDQSTNTSCIGVKCSFNNRVFRSSDPKGEELSITAQFGSHCCYLQARTSQSNVYESIPCRSKPYAEVRQGGWTLERPRGKTGWKSGSCND